MAQPAYKKTQEKRELVQKLALAGYDDTTIAKHIDASEATLHRHHRFDLDYGREKANGEVGNTLYRMAVSGEYPQVSMFWAKTRMGWRETDRLEMTGKDGGPVQHEHRAVEDIVSELKTWTSNTAADDAEDA